MVHGLRFQTSFKFHTLNFEPFLISCTYSRYYCSYLLVVFCCLSFSDGVVLSEVRRLLCKFISTITSSAIGAESDWSYATGPRPPLNQSDYAYAANWWKLLQQYFYYNFAVRCSVLPFTASQLQCISRVSAAARKKLQVAQLVSGCQNPSSDDRKKAAEQLSFLVGGKSETQIESDAPCHSEL